MALPFVKKLQESRLPTETVVAAEPEASWRTMRGQAVGDSADLRRILALPRRPRPSDADLAVIAAELKRRFGLVRTTPCECRSRWGRRCADTLLPTQAWALHEAEQVGGILGPIGVGHGKTLLDILVSMVVGAKTAVLLLPPNLKRQFLEVDWHYYAQHWQVPNLAGGKFYTPGRPFLHVIAFSELSGAKATSLLGKDGLTPDILIVDEAHNVRNRTAARTKRFLRYFKDFPNCKLFCWSGTLTSKSLRDYAHLSTFSLRDGSPVPTHYAAIEEWAAALDPSDLPSPPGQLLRLGAGDVRENFQRRLVETAGVVSSGDSASCQASLVISERKVQTPQVVLQHIQALEASWQRPDGEELVDALSKARCARELSCGFYYRWRWPRGEPVPVIERWLETRKNWHKELREKLKKGGPHMDSPLLLTKAAIRWQKGYTYVEKDESGKEIGRVQVQPQSRSGPLPTWSSEFWPEWEAVRETAKPSTEPVWLHSFLVDDATSWLEDGPGIFWYEFAALAEQINQVAQTRKLQLVFAGPGDSGDKAIQLLQGSEPVLASIRAHGTGKNIQCHSRACVGNPPSSGSDWEQLLGRLHRKGQEADEVNFEVYRHTEAFRNAIDRARDLSEYIQDSFGARQRLASIATWRF